MTAEGVDDEIWVARRNWIGVQEGDVPILHAEITAMHREGCARGLNPVDVPSIVEERRRSVQMLARTVCGGGDLAQSCTASAPQPDG